MLDIVTAAAVSLASQAHTETLVEKLCFSVARGNLEVSSDIFEEPNIASMIHQLARHDLTRVVSALLGLASLPRVITRTVWSCLGSDQTISPDITNLLPEYIDHRLPPKVRMVRNKYHVSLFSLEDTSVMSQYRVV